MGLQACSHHHLPDQKNFAWPCCMWCINQLFAKLSIACFSPMNIIMICSASFWIFPSCRRLHYSPLFESSHVLRTCSMCIIHSFLSISSEPQFHLVVLGEEWLSSFQVHTHTKLKIQKIQKLIWWSTKLFKIQH